MIKTSFGTQCSAMSLYNLISPDYGFHTYAEIFPIKLTGNVPKTVVAIGGIEPFTLCLSTFTYA